jgi:hypothetical protein
MPLSTLCQSCGLCCDGSLFSHVPLEPPEVEAVRALGLPVARIADGSLAMPLPCPALARRSCSLYGERPLGCRRFGCRLYAALDAGEIGLTAALAVVGEAHLLLAGLAARLPDRDEGGSVLERARFGDLCDEGGLSAAARAARESVEAHLDRHFHGGPRRFPGAREL